MDIRDDSMFTVQFSLSLSLFFTVHLSIIVAIDQLNAQILVF